MDKKRRYYAFDLTSWYESNLVGTAIPNIKINHHLRDMDLIIPFDLNVDRV